MKLHKSGFHAGSGLSPHISRGEHKVRRNKTPYFTPLRTPRSPREIICTICDRYLALELRQLVTIN